MHLGFGINLSPSVQQEPNHDDIPPPGRNVQRSDTVLHRKRCSTYTGACFQEPSVAMEIRTAAAMVISYLWGKVDISTSVEQQLSYIQVFVMCSDV